MASIYYVPQHFCSNFQHNTNQIKNYTQKFQPPPQKKAQHKLNNFFVLVVCK